MIGPSFPERMDGSAENRTAAQRPVYYEGGSGENNQAYKWSVCLRWL